jgi:hypothetical protein
MGQNAVGDRIRLPQTQHYRGVYIPIKMHQQTPSYLVCKCVPTDDTLYVPAIATTVI